MRDRLYFVGPGRAGLSLGYALTHVEGLESLTYSGRRPDPPTHPLFTQGAADYVYGLVLPPEGTTAVILSVPDADQEQRARGRDHAARRPDPMAACRLPAACGLPCPLHDRFQMARPWLRVADDASEVRALFAAVRRRVGDLFR